MDCLKPKGGSWPLHSIRLEKKYGVIVSPMEVIVLGAIENQDQGDIHSCLCMCILSPVHSKKTVKVLILFHKNVTYPTI